MKRCLCFLMIGLTACRPALPPPITMLESWNLLAAPAAAQWQPAGIPDQGRVEVVDEELSLHAGQPLTGAKWTGWDASLPSTHYVIEYEAQRIEGEDIFGMITFPVGSHQSHATFVLGGWGGTVTGISSIEFMDAGENQTRGEQRFQNNQWYRVRVEVRPEDLRAWVDDRLVVNASIKGRQVSLRPGFIDHCLPFGFATYATTGKVRRVIISRLKI